MDTFNRLFDWANRNQGALTLMLFLLSFVLAWVSGIFRWIICRFDLFRKFCKNHKQFMSVDKAREVKSINPNTSELIFIQKSGKNSVNVQGKNISIGK